MPSTYVLPALPVAVVLAAAGTAGTWARLRRRGDATVLRFVAGAALAVYAAVVVTAVLLPVRVGAPDDGTPWTAFLNLTPLAGTDPHDMLQNVVLFVPLGLLLPVVRLRSAGQVLAAGLAASLGIEVLQLVADVAADGRHAADVNDLLANTLGALVGYGLLHALVRVPPVGRLVRAATWPARARPGGGDGRAAGRTRGAETRPSTRSS